MQGELLLLRAPTLDESAESFHAGRVDLFPVGWLEAHRAQFQLFLWRRGWPAAWLLWFFHEAILDHVFCSTNKACKVYLLFYTNHTPTEPKSIMNSKQANDIFKNAIARKAAPVSTPASRTKARRAVVDAQVSALRSAIEAIRSKARETPAWAPGYNSAVTTIEMQLAELLGQP